MRDLVHELHDPCRFQRWKGQQQQKSGHELRPNKERQTHPGHPRSPHLDDGGDEIHCAKQRGSDQQHHSDQPESLAIGGNRCRQRGIRGPAGLGRPARDEEARQHDHAAQEIDLVARHVHARERHVHRANLQRNHVVAEGSKSERHDGQEHHDRAMHRPEGIIQVWRHDAIGGDGSQRSLKAAVPPGVSAGLDARFASAS